MPSDALKGGGAWYLSKSDILRIQNGLVIIIHVLHKEFKGKLRKEPEEHASILEQLPARRES
jgi:hypothetical protein